MVVINKSQVSIRDDGQGLMTEASSLELQPGEWPDMISVVDDKNEGFLFLKARRMLEAGEFLGYLYQSRQGFTLEVFND